MVLIYLRVLLNAELMPMLYVIWEASVLVGQLLALQESNAVGWMTKESSNNFRQGKVSVIFKASKQPLRPAQLPIQSVLRGKWLGQEANHLSLSSARVSVCGALCAVPPHPFIPSLFGA
jgi:hypothetical protein